jgi:hypothetical protein
LADKKEIEEINKEMDKFLNKDYFNSVFSKINVDVKIEEQLTKVNKKENKNG